MKKVFLFLREVFSGYAKDNAHRLAAALAYYTIFSLAPLLVIVIAIVGFVFGPEAAAGQIVDQISDILGQRVALAIQQIIIRISQPSSSITATIFGLVILLFGASQVFNHLNYSLNTIWNVRPNPNRGIWGPIKHRVFAVSLVLATGFLLLVTLVLSAFLAAVIKYFQNLFPWLGTAWQIANFLISFGITTAIFGLVMKYIPDVKVRWRDVWVGSLVTSLLFSLGRLLLSFYLGWGTFGSTYGAAASLIVLLFWIYYSGQILFIGAEFTQVYAKSRGAPIEPAKNAVYLRNPEKK